MSAILDKLPQEFAKRTRRLLTPVVENVSSRINTALKGKLVDKINSQSGPAKILRSFGNNKTQVKQLKVAYARLQRRSAQTEARLHKLEKMLSSEELRHSVLLYYQLESLWTFCHKMLAMHLKKLVLEFEGRERDKMLGGYRAQQEKDSKKVSDRVARLEKERKSLNSQKHSLLQEINTKKQIWHFFSRRELTARLEELKTELEPIDNELAKGQQAQDKLHSAQPPKLGGISLLTKRVINNHLIAYAQFYYAYFSIHDISKLMKSIRNRSPSECNFGSLERCQRIEQIIREKKIRLKANKDLRKVIARQAKRVMSQSRYTSNQEAMPRVNSLAFMLSMNNFVDNKPDNNDRGKGVVNIVQDNYWDVNKLLLR